MHENIEPDFSNFKIHDKFKEHQQPTVKSEINDYASARALLPSAMVEEIDKHAKKSAACVWAAVVLTAVYWWQLVLPWYGYVFVFLGFAFVLVSFFARPSKIPVPVAGLYKKELRDWCENGGEFWHPFDDCCYYKHFDGFKTITKYKHRGKIFNFVSFGGENRPEILISIE